MIISWNSEKAQNIKVKTTVGIMKEKKIIVESLHCLFWDNTQGCLKTTRNEMKKKIKTHMNTTNQNQLD